MFPHFKKGLLIDFIEKINKIIFDDDTFEKMLKSKVSKLKGVR